MSAVTFGSRARHVSYSTARWIITAAGLVALVAIAGVMYATRVDTVEVSAVLLYVPVFLVFMVAGVPGGLVSGAAAAGTYAAIRYPSLHAIGGRDFVTLVLSRAPGYLAFGLIGGWAKGQLQASITKLDLYDRVDDDSGLYNAHHFVTTVDYEIQRARRYQRIFSVVSADVADSALRALGRRRARRASRDLGSAIRVGIRTVDQPVHSSDGTRHRFAVILPDTGPEGARLFAARFGPALAERLLVHRAGHEPVGVVASALSYPDDAAEIDSLTREFSADDRFQRGGRNAAGPAREP